jgi:hypothetical protein
MSLDKDDFKWFYAIEEYRGFHEIFNKSNYEYKFYFLSGYSVNYSYVTYMKIDVLLGETIINCMN